jgi:hypothetical protein
MDSALLNAREKAAVLWAEHVTKNTARSRDDVFEQVKEIFDEQEIVELTMICGLFNFRNRYMDSLRIPLEPVEEVDKIKSSSRLNTDNLKRYLEFVLENWPEEFPEPNPDE